MSQSLPFPVAPWEKAATGAASTSTNPRLSTGDDSAAAQNLIRLYSESQTELRRVVACGLAAWEIKETRLQHGEWGYWLGAHAPGLCRLDSVTGRPKAGSQLIAHMELAKNILARIGFPTIESYFHATAKFPKSGICAGGGFLLVQENEVPPEFMPLRQKICALVDGKSQRHLSGKSTTAPNAKYGRIAAEVARFKDLIDPIDPAGGQSAPAVRLAGEELRLIKLEADLEALHDWLPEIANVSSLGMMTDHTIKNFCDVAEAAAAFGRRVLETRKGILP
jgi:hypothetical protein